MKLAIISITKNGARLAMKIANNKHQFENIECHQLDVFVKEAYLKVSSSENYRVLPIREKISNCIQGWFEYYDGLIFIMATGIVVRVIAPYVQNKIKDPAIVTLDERGQNVISLLSGHLGGANELTYEISNILDANPVITTASDVNKKISVDMLGKSLDAQMTSLEDAKTITAMIVNQEKVAIISSKPIKMTLPDNVDLIEIKEPIDVFLSKEKKSLVSYSGFIIVDHCRHIPLQSPFAHLVPQNIHLGIGCRRNKSFQEIKNALENQLTLHNIHDLSLKAIHSIDVKKDEKGIIDLSKAYHLPFYCYTKEALVKYDDIFEGSDFVKKTVGVRSVSEASGYLGSKEGNCIVPKEKYDGITLALFLES